MAMRSSDQFMTKYYSAIRTACKVPFLSVIRGGWHLQWRDIVLRTEHSFGKVQSTYQTTLAAEPLE